jgi:hypothetical protein
MDTISLDMLKLICMDKNIAITDLINLQKTCTYLWKALNSKKLIVCWNWKYGPLWKKKRMKKHIYLKETPHSDIINVLKKRDELKGQEMIYAYHKNFHKYSTCWQEGLQRSMSPYGFELGDDLEGGL